MLGIIVAFLLGFVAGAFAVYKFHHLPMVDDLKKAIGLLEAEIKQLKGKVKL